MRANKIAAGCIIRGNSTVPAVRLFPLNHDIDIGIGADRRHLRDICQAVRLQVVCRIHKNQDCPAWYIAACSIRRTRGAGRKIGVTRTGSRVASIIVSGIDRPARAAAPGQCRTHYTDHANANTPPSPEISAKHILKLPSQPSVHSHLIRRDAVRGRGRNSEFLPSRNFQRNRERLATSEGDLL